MSNHHDDFWGDEATWSSRPASTERFDDGTPVPFDATSGHTFEIPRTGALGMMRDRWNRLMGSGANATREHGIVRPAVIPDDIDHIDHIDHTTTFGALDEPTPVWIDDEPTPTPASTWDTTPTRHAGPARTSTPTWNATMFDDIDHDIATETASLGGIVGAPTQRSGHEDDVDDSTNLDPTVARLGALAVIATLLIPVMFGFGSGGDDGDAVQTATQSQIGTPSAEGAAVPTPVVLAGGGVVPAAPEVVTTDGDTNTTAQPSTGQSSTAPDTQPATTPAAGGESVDMVRQPTSAALESNTVVVDEVEAAAEVDDASAADRLIRNCAVDYEVVAGDFWIRIADGAGVELDELLEANGASTDTALFPGGSICLPAGSSIPAPPTTAAAATTAAPSTTEAPATTTAPTTAAPTTTTTTTTTAPATTLPPNSNASADQVKQIIRDVWPDELEDRAIEIAFRESRYVPTAQNFCCSGLFQIYFSVHKSWLSDLGINSVNDLYDPVANTRAAYTLYQRAGGWGPWGF